jgi:predicted nuclease of predicted toxin-antitoxin system
MKLLFDENLSPTLAERLKEKSPGSAHVRTLGLKGPTIW